MRLIYYYKTKLISFFLLISIHVPSNAQESIPKFPNNIETPNQIGYSCISDATNFPSLEVCRANIENARDHAEEYNIRIKRFCDSIVSADARLRSRAKSRKLSWDNYEIFKVEIRNVLIECDESKGDYYAPYRARIREYKQGIALIKTKRKAIVDQIGF